MAEQGSEEKTEAPSEKKRQDARKKGTVAKSTEVNSVLVLFVAILLFKLVGPWMIEELTYSIREIFKLCSQTDMGMRNFLQLSRKTILLVFKLVLPLCGSILVAGVLANVVQIGLLFTLEPLTPKLEKINPLSGAQRLFSMKAIVDTVKNLLKIAIIGYIAYDTLRGKYEQLLVLSDASVYTIWEFTLASAFEIFLKTAIVLLFLALLDYAYQRYEYEKKLKMTHQEVKEERKQMDGDPQVKSRIRSLQREMARRRMMEEVPEATVVVTNPTHIAIALKYEPSENDAPVVIAKGKRFIAERIKKMAQENDIPIVEDKPLARAMYDKVEIGLPIPMEFFTAVAEILAYVFKLKNKAAA
ncbi:MAG: flagellar biosynthesis protein FlhB [Chitinispirillaceae bacterium]